MDPSNESSRLSSRLRVLRKEGRPTGRPTATVYVKGFGQAGEDHKDWFEQHCKIESRYGFCSDVFGYVWPSGDMKTGVGVIGNLPGLGLGLGGVILRRFHPALAGVGFGVDALRWWWNYQEAEEKAIEFAPYLARDIMRLNNEYEKVWVVAHSLGGRLVLEAVKNLSDEDHGYLPWRVDLCAPAACEDEVKGILGRGIAQDRAWLYYTDKDWTLRWLRWLARGGEAMGAHGLEGRYWERYRNLTAVDVSEKFDFLVHKEYENRFARIVEGEGLSSLAGRGQETRVFLPRGDIGLFVGASGPAPSVVKKEAAPSDDEATPIPAQEQVPPSEKNWLDEWLEEKRAQVAAQKKAIETGDAKPMSAEDIRRADLLAQAKKEFAERENERKRMEKRGSGRGLRWAITAAAAACLGIPWL